MVSIVVACNRRGIIGRDGKLPWRLPEDMRLFKERTWGHVVIMGRKTWESLPKRPLRGRINIVLTKNYIQVPNEAFTGSDAASIVVSDSLGEALRCAEMFAPGKEVFIIGGAQVYRTALESGVVDRIFLSLVDDDSDQPDDVRWQGTFWGGLSLLNWRSTKLADYDGFELWEHAKT